MGLILLTSTFAASVLYLACSLAGPILVAACLLLLLARAFRLLLLEHRRDQV